MARLWVALAVVSVAGCGSCRPHSGSADASTERRYRKLDTHVHINHGGVPRSLALMNEWGLDVVVNLSGGWPDHGLEQSLAEAAQANGRVVVFANAPLLDVVRGNSAQVLEALERAKREGAKGLKIFKSLGLGLRDDTGALIAVDDPRLDPLFEACGRLGLPVAIHTGDPVAFWEAVTPSNERIDELTVHPAWSNFGQPVPSWEDLFSAYERRVARHPNTTFIGVHFGNAPEDPARVARMLDSHSNLFVDLAARVPELGRTAPEVLRPLLIAHQDRILFGTDLGLSADPTNLMLGSTGAAPPTPAEVARFFTSTWRWLETNDRQFEHPTPIQGRWKIDGVGLPPEVLRKIYWDNGAKLLGL